MVTESSFDVPDPVFRNLVLETKPIRAGRTVPPPIKTRMIGEDLDTGANDEHHQEEIEEMQQTQPQRETRIHRRRGRGAAGVARDECLHAGHRAQLLADRDADDPGERRPSGIGPQDIDRSATQPNERGPRPLAAAATRSDECGHPQCSSLSHRAAAPPGEALSHEPPPSCELRSYEPHTRMQLLGGRRGRLGLSLRPSSQQKVSQHDGVVMNLVASRVARA